MCNNPSWTKVFRLVLSGVTAFLGASGLWASEALAQCEPGGPGPDAVSVLTTSEVDVFGCFNGTQAFVALGGVCNVGTAPLPGDISDNHPMMTQNLYRLESNRFEQIGMSWVKHDDWTSGSESCGSLPCTPCESLVPPCCDNPASCSPIIPRTLGVGCQDIYQACQNSYRWALGPRSQINAATGDWPVGAQLPPCNDPTRPDVAIACRLQVQLADLEAGIGYFLEQQVITPDETSVTTRNNNVSYTDATVGGATSSALDGCCDPFIEPCPTAPGCIPYPLTADPAPFCQEPAIKAWKDVDPSVMETEFQVPNDGLFILAAKATPIGLGWWSYEYALYNMNSDRSAGAFRVPLPTDPQFQICNIGFHDINYHSGDIWDGTDWLPANVAPGSITWATPPYAPPENANALRWGTLYNFRFEAKRAPNYASTVTIDLFKPGTPSSVTGVSVAPGPAASPVVVVGACCVGGTCTLNTELSCLYQGGMFTGSKKCKDCNLNGVVDACESFGACCTGSSCSLIPEACCTNGTFKHGQTRCGGDCNLNGVPDGCEAGTSDPLGACCVCNSGCEVMLASCCTTRAGTFGGAGTYCEDCNGNGVPAPCEGFATREYGACCKEDGGCNIATQCSCHGEFAGVGLTCNSCPAPLGPQLEPPDP